MPKASPTTEIFLQKYGDILFDFCESLLGPTPYAQEIFLKILNTLVKAAPENSYEEYERAWVLRLSLQLLREAYRVEHPSLTAEEQIRADSIESPSQKLKHFDLFFSRVNFSDRILLLLRDKYGLSYSEIAAALTIPEASLKTQRTQALRALSDWIWGEETA